jgi:hypothetical protein
VDLKGASYKLPEAPRWTDQKDCNHPDLSRQRTRILPGRKNWGESVSSLKLDPGTRVAIFKWSDFGGDYLIYENLTDEVMRINSLPAGWNDQVKSVQVDNGLRRGSLSVAVLEQTRNCITIQQRNVIRTEADLANLPAQAPVGTIPLYLWYNSGRTDNFVQAHSDTEDSAESAGYREIRTEGYVYPAN